MATTRASTRWCLESLDELSRSKRKQCEDDERVLNLTWNGYTLDGDECRFVSVRRTGDRWAPATHTPWSMQIPEVEFVVRCSSDGYTNKYRMHIGKGGVLRIETVVPLSRPRPQR